MSGILKSSFEAYNETNGAKAIADIQTKNFATTGSQDHPFGRPLSLGNQVLLRVIHTIQIFTALLFLNKHLFATACGVWNNLSVLKGNEAWSSFKVNALKLVEDIAILGINLVGIAAPTLICRKANQISWQTFPAW